MELVTLKERAEKPKAEGNATQRSVTARKLLLSPSRGWRGGGRKRNQDFLSPGTRQPVTLTGRGLYWNRTHSKPWQRGRRPSAFLPFSSEFPGPPIRRAPEEAPASAVTWVTVCWETASRPTSYLSTAEPILCQQRAQAYPPYRVRFSEKEDTFDSTL